MTIPNPNSTADFRPVQRLGDLVAWATVAVAVAVRLPLEFLSWGRVARLENHVDGRVPLRELQDGELGDLVWQAGLTVVALLFAVAWVWALVTWVARARDNTERCTPHTHRVPRRWAVLGWFVPFVSYWVVPVVLNDISWASDPRTRAGDRRRADRGVTALMALLIAGGVGFVLVLLVIPTPVITYGTGIVIAGGEEAVAAYRATAVGSSALSLLTILAAVVFASVVQRISRWQTGSFPTSTGPGPDLVTPAQSEGPAARPLTRRSAAPGHPEAPSTALGTATAIAVWVVLPVGPLMLHVAGLVLSGTSGNSDVTSPGPVLFGLGMLGTIVGTTVAGILVTTWMWRARSNAELSNPGAAMLPAAWSVAGWFVPPANLAIPAVAMADILRGSLLRAPALLATWWGGWIGGWLLFWLGLSPIFTPAPLGPPAFIVLMGLATGLFALSAACLTTIIRRVDRQQAALPLAERSGAST